MDKKLLIFTSPTLLSSTQQRDPQLLLATSTIGHHPPTPLVMSRPARVAVRCCNAIDFSLNRCSARFGQTAKHTLLPATNNPMMMGWDAIPLSRRFSQTSEMCESVQFHPINPNFSVLFFIYFIFSTPPSLPRATPWAIGCFYCIAARCYLDCIISRVRCCCCCCCCRCRHRIFIIKTQ